jgi:hypothetical protein
MDGPGGSIISERLNKLREDIREYYGKINEIKQGLAVKDLVKPEALVYYEFCRVLHTPYISGGIIDQPYILLLEFEVCMTESELMENANRGANGSSQAQPTASE